MKNIGGKPANLTGWKLMDSRRNRRHAFIFPPFTLKPGATVTVHTGKGANTDIDLCWGKKRPVWNNGGDTAYLYDAQGNLIDECSWKGEGSGEIICHLS